ncbi:TorF family putative porin [Thalassotalea sp. PLHSN55]|uniref:TorF family putative porin n=1 Tax=Thalassotalea sp. PLHSN55 TaxID=3435888 RepID=UPI003F82AF20
MNKYIFIAVINCLVFFSMNAIANISATINLASDYTFNGVSQTGNDPALQGSLDYANDNGFYVGTWASNVDFGAGDDTNIEWDAYIGQYFQLNKQIGLDTGIAYYTYRGDSLSDEYNYPEAYAKLSYNSSMGDSELNFWYTWDYFGLDVKHYIAMVAHNVEIAPGHTIRVSFDRSVSADEDKWSWDNSDAYNHYRIAYMTSWNGLDFDLAVEDTNMDIESADARVVLSVSYTLNL